jgi:hypothetical protein
MATSKEKLAELKAKKEKEFEEKAETLAIQKLYANKNVFDNSKNKTTDIINNKK